MAKINEKTRKRLSAQAEEANFLGLRKIAHSIYEQVEDSELRGDEGYKKTYSQLKEDVERQLWSIAVEIQDFYQATADAPKVHETIESISSELIDTIRIDTGVMAGAYEPTVPGEESVKVQIDE